jgi:acyl carrier protein
MTAESVMNWLGEWFRENGSVPDDDLPSLEGFDYFDQKIIDSFGVIEMIAAIETRFDMAFTPEDFQKRQFKTVDGLAKLVVNRLQEADRAAA